MGADVKHDEGQQASVGASGLRTDEEVNTQAARVASLRPETVMIAVTTTTAATAAATATRWYAQNNKY